MFGASVAGCSCARALALRGLRVLLVGAPAAHRPRPRIETLAPGVESVLRALDLWRQFASRAFTPCWYIESAWGASPAIVKDFAFHPQGHAWSIDRGGLESLLREGAREVGVRAVTGRLVSIQRSARWVALVDAADGLQVFHADYVVDATGLGAALARKLGCEREVFDRLVVLQGRCEAGTDRGAVILEAADEGWWFSISTQADRVVSFVTDAVSVRQGRGSHELYMRALRRTRAMAGYHARMGSVVGVRAETSRLVALHADRAIAIGDAAISRDPLSGMGCLAALEDGVHTAAVIDRALQGERSSAEHATQREREWLDVLASHQQAYSVSELAGRPFWDRRTMLHAAHRSAVGPA